VFSPPPPGTRIGKYKVVGTLGRGGMGGVWEVEDESGHRYALKSPINDVGGVGEVTRRFAREANALRLLDHPNVVSAVDVFVEAGMLFLVMERVVGHSLTSAMTDGRLSPRRALVLTRQLLDGVGHAHAHGIAHRDLKPDNIILVPMGSPPSWERAKIIDFGLVKLIGDAAAAYGQNALTNTGLVVGTPAYMAPEQCLGRFVDARADLYSIGIILFEMLTGTLPFRDKDPQVVLRMHVKMPPPRLDQVSPDAPWCTPELIGLVEGALVKEPAHRFASAADMIKAIDTAFFSIDHLP
jgi:serine/threonine-protein kinase